MVHIIDDMLATAEIPQEREEQMEAALIAECELGVAAEEFLESQVGRYVVGAADQEMKRIKDDLIGVDPLASKAIADLQAQYQARCLAIRWLCEAVKKGKDAARVIERYSDD